MLLVISVLPIIIIGKYIYKKDNEQEPFKIVFKLFFGGLLSCLMVLAITVFLGLIFPFIFTNVYYMNWLELLFYAFVIVALVEESSKWFFVYKLSYNSKYFDQIYDMIVYSCFVSLGFACFENIIYVFNNGFVVGIIRALSAVPLHACNGVIMGLFLGLAKYYDVRDNDNLKKRFLFFSLLVPVMIHGFYDFSLFSLSIILHILVLIFVICLYIFSIKKVNFVSSFNRRIKYKDNFCPNCGRKIDSDFCPNCGRKNF